MGALGRRRGSVGVTQLLGGGEPNLVHVAQTLGSPGDAEGRGLLSVDAEETVFILAKTPQGLVCVPLSSSF